MRELQKELHKLSAIEVFFHVVNQSCTCSHTTFLAPDDEPPCATVQQTKEFSQSNIQEPQEVDLLSLFPHQEILEDVLSTVSKLGDSFNSFSKEIRQVVERNLSQEQIAQSCHVTVHSGLPDASYLPDHSSSVEISILCMLFLHLITKISICCCSKQSKYKRVFKFFYFHTLSIAKFG